MEKDSKGDYQAVLDSALALRDIYSASTPIIRKDLRGDEPTRTTHPNQVMQAVEYYHNNILQSAKSLTNSGAGLKLGETNGESDQYSRQRLKVTGKYSSASSEINGNRSCKAHLHPHNQNSSYSIIGCNNAYHNYEDLSHPKPFLRKCDYMYCSNTSLDLDSTVDVDKTSTSAKREYGSHGSLHLPSGNNNYFNVAKNFESLTQEDSHSLTNKSGDTSVFTCPTSLNVNNNDNNDIASPKPKNKFSKFWDSKEKSRSKQKMVTSEPFLFWKLRTNVKIDASVVNNKALENEYDSRMDDKAKRKGFAHYDCQSVTVNLSYVSRLRTLLAKRRNTTTGASAASVGNRAPIDNEDNSDETDRGDGKSNELLLSCPFFRNELGGEEERNISLTRSTYLRNKKYHSSSVTKCLHRPVMAYGIGILEYPPGQTHWTIGLCPFMKNDVLLECFDDGAGYYKQYFFNQDHQNWIGMDENLGPIAVSIKREKAVNEDNKSVNYTLGSHYIYRIIIRTSELATLRGSILEEYIPTIKPSTFKGIPAKEVIEYVAPEVQSQCLKLANSPQTEAQLLKLDQQGISHNYKVGVMYCKAGQSTEEEMYNNEDAGPAFIEFLDLIGQRVKLKDFDRYRAGLDNKTDSTGIFSVYSQFKTCEVMFHVSTMLPFTPNNRQQLLRKRHIGNDIVTIIFQEPGARPFTPKTIRSHFQHVFIVVRVIDPCSESTRYRLAVSRSKEVAVFGPPIPEHATFMKSESFRDFLLQKVINAENAAHRAEKFSTMATRTRQEYLKDLAANFVSNTSLETTSKFSLMGFTSKKKEKSPVRAPVDSVVRGALAWSVQTEDCYQNCSVDSVLAISQDSLIIIEESTKEVIFVCSCQSILGWTQQSGGLRVYFHQGESVYFVLSDDTEDICMVMGRLKGVTRGAQTQELTLKRNNVGQLGFHVQHDGLVTEVEAGGPADQCGLKQGCRLVEICKVAVATLNHEQMVDLLKTSEPVVVSVIPPLREGIPRRGCNSTTCPYPHLGYEGDYENLFHPSSDLMTCSVSKLNHKRPERSSSPPRSSNSSGYGTGSSSKSFTHSLEMTTGSSLSASPGGEDRWQEPGVWRESSPPPLPARSRLPYLRLQEPSPSYHCQTPSFGPNTLNIKPDCEIGSREEFTISQDSPSGIDAGLNKGLKEKLKLKPFHLQDDSAWSNHAFERSHPVSDDSEDLSGSSSTVTPSLDRRRETSSTTSTTSTSSSTHSPRLRPGVHHSRANRSNSTLPSSSVQEDLMRLINPDYGSNQDETKSYQLSQSHSMTSVDSHVKLEENNDHLCKSLTIGEGLDRCWRGGHTIEPHTCVTVFDSTSTPGCKTGCSSPRYHEKLKIEESKLGSTTGDSEPLPLPDTHNMDWPTLVDTATKAIQQIQSYSTSDASDNESVAKLQCQLQKKNDEYALLQCEVESLKTENRRLLEENQIASRQIRDFTTWILSNSENNPPQPLHKVQLYKYPCDN